MSNKLKELLEQNENNLKGVIIQNALDSGDPKTYLEDVTSHGCQSGMVNELIYTVDCQKFFDAYYEDIQESIESFESMTGEKFCLDTSLDIKNHLAWFGYEHEAFNILSQIEND